MAISAYVGVPGSGKSYEAVKSVILPAFLSGRRIVTNIEGISHQSFYDYAIKNKFKPELFGKIIKVSDDDVKGLEFFPYKGSSDTICKAGDLIIVDEVWRIWSNEKLPENHRSFISEHRHFIDNSSGVCCDLVVINQSISNLPRFLKDRIESTYRMSKLKSLGFTSRYKVEVYSSSKCTKSNLTRKNLYKYDKNIFSLYNSYDGQNGKELTTDKRQSVFSSSTVIFLIVFVIMMLFISTYFAYSFFNPETKKSDSHQITKIDKPINTTNDLNKSLPISNDKPVNTSAWRISGFVTSSGKSFVILLNSSGNYRFLPRSFCDGRGYLISCDVDGSKVTLYTGL